jgi:hypothetical protein
VIDLCNFCNSFNFFNDSVDRVARSVTVSRSGAFSPLARNCIRAQCDRRQSPSRASQQRRRKIARRIRQKPTRDARLSIPDPEKITEADCQSSGERKQVEEETEHFPDTQEITKSDPESEACHRRVEQQYRCVGNAKRTV